MKLRKLVLTGLAGAALHLAAWQLLVPALFDFSSAMLPPPLWTTAFALAAILPPLAWAVMRTTTGDPPVTLPVEIAIITSAAGAMGAVGMYLTQGVGGLQLRADSAMASAGFSLTLGPAAAAAVAELAGGRARHGRAIGLAPLSAASVVLAAAGGWLLLAPVLLQLSHPGTRPVFTESVGLLLAAAMGSAWLLAWMVGRQVGRDLVEAAVAVRWLDAPSLDPAGGGGAPAAVASETKTTGLPTPTPELAELSLAAAKLRARLSRELTAFDHALTRSRDADAAREEFLRVVSHELRTPLNSICGYAQLLIEGLDGPLGVEAKDSVQSVLDSGRQLSALVDDVVDLAMLTSGRPGLKLAAVDMGALAREVARAHAALVHGRPLELRLEVPVDLPPVLADRKRVRQVMTNLISNALKFTDGGHVLCALRAGGSRSVEVEVSDTGVGIAEAELAGIFDEFRQGSNLGARRQQGAGLGLAICRRLVELHGGHIRAESRPGEGARFIFSLPVEGPGQS